MNSKNQWYEIKIAKRLLTNMPDILIKVIVLKPFTTSTRSVWIGNFFLLQH